MKTIVYDCKISVLLNWIIHHTLDTHADQTNVNRARLNVNIADNTDNEFLTTDATRNSEYTPTTIPPFRHIPFALDILRCQRYFQIKLTQQSIF